MGSKKREFIDVIAHPYFIYPPWYHIDISLLLLLVDILCVLRNSCTKQIGVYILLLFISRNNSILDMALFSGQVLQMLNCYLYINGCNGNSLTFKHRNLDHTFLKGTNLWYTLVNFKNGNSKMNEMSHGGSIINIIIRAFIIKWKK